VGRPAVFLDRDGTVIVDKVHLTDPDDVELVPGAAESLRRLNGAGLSVVIVSNQSVIARGMTTREQVDAAMDRLQELLLEEGAFVDAFYYCPHHEDFSGPCDCRKPKPGMLFDASVEHDLDLGASYMVGDWWSDIGAGQAAGLPSILVRGSTWDGIPVEAKLEEHGLVPDVSVDSLGEAVDWILEDLGWLSD
jgi:D-glycero-D-manno-heptose 1,7-bisphosphate phosphatase